MSMFGGGSEVERRLGRDEEGKRYRGVPSREDIPGVEDLEAW
jgi:hypothetical protein